MKTKKTICIFPFVIYFFQFCDVDEMVITHKRTWKNSTIKKNMKGKKLIFVFFGYLLEACIEIWQIFLIFLVFHELSAQHVLENLNSKTTIVPWQLWHKLYICIRGHRRVLSK